MFVLKNLSFKKKINTYMNENTIKSHENVNKLHKFTFL